MTAEQALEILTKGKCWVAHDAWTDESGLAHLLDTTTKTLGAWRAQGLGPPSKRTNRIVYEIADVVDWFNAGGNSADQKSQSRSQTSEELGR